MLDGGTVRFALLATAPFLFCVSLFFSLQVRARSRRPLLTYFAHTIYSGDHKHLVCAGPRRAVPREQPVLQRGGAEAKPGGRQPPPAHHDPDAGVQGESEGDDVRVLSPFFPGVILVINVGLGAHLHHWLSCWGPLGSPRPKGFARDRRFAFGLGRRDRDCGVTRVLERGWGLSRRDVSMRTCFFLSCQWRMMECRCEMEIRRRCLSGLLLR